MMRKTLTAVFVSMYLTVPVSYAGDAAAGAKAFSSKGCTACHGKTGMQPTAANYPVIGGKPADFLSAELIKFKTGERKEPTMNAMAGLLNDDDIANIAAYLASQ